MFSKKKMLVVGAFMAAVAASSAFFLGGCGNQQQQQTQQGTQVKVMKALKQDTPLTLEYAGTIKGKDEVKVQSKASGTIIEKYVKGGDLVTAGQPLYRIDSRQYESNLLAAQASLAQAQATLNNSMVDLERDQSLYAAAAISEQVVTTQQSVVTANQANVDALAAKVRLAQENLDDCLVVAPMSGKLAVDDVAVGTYVAQGSTTLVTIGNTGEMFAQFSLSENEYLKFNGGSDSAIGSIIGTKVLLTLSNGKQYPIAGKIVEVDRAMGTNTSSIAVKALFDNPNGVLVSGMFARVQLQGEVARGAVLVPQRAVQQLLGKSFVMVVGDDGKSKACPIELGDRIGSYYIITKGLTGNEQVIVEGLTTLTEGKDLIVSEVTAQDMGFSFTDSSQKSSL